MRNITMSVDEDTYTAVSARVRGFLERLVRDRTDGCGARRRDAETERERRARLLDEVFEDICAKRSGFRAADNLGREALHDRHVVR